MKRIGFAGTAIASLLLYGFASVGYAQHDQPDDHNKPHDQGRGQQHQAQPQQQRGDRHDQGQHRGQSDHRGSPQDRHQQQFRDNHDRGARDNHDRGGWDQHRARHFEAEHRSWRDRGGYRGYMVPRDDFRRRFGRNHYFRIFGLPFMEVGGYPRFQYGGLWFSMAEPYPEYWGDNWYRGDDMYVDYNDGGYYLYNRRFPGRPGVAIVISR